MIIKRILGLLLILCISSSVSAIDIVTLTNGKILEGKITDKDSDGGILLILPSGIKRYIMPDEIDVISQNDIPFSNIVEKEERSDTPKFTVYATYENLNYSKFILGVHKLDINKNSSGFSLGVSAAVDLYKGLHFVQALEVAYDTELMDSNYPLPDIFNRDPTSHWSNNIHQGRYWFNVRLPLQIGYQLILNPNMKLQLQTGPVIDCFIGTKDGDDLEVNPDIWFHYNNYPECFMGCEYNRFNVDWRFGLNLNIKQFMIGVTYNLGMTNRLTKGYQHVYGNTYGSPTYIEIDIDAKQMRNYFQFKVGYTF